MSLFQGEQSHFCELSFASLHPQFEGCEHTLEPYAKFGLSADRDLLFGQTLDPAFLLLPEIPRHARETTPQGLVKLPMAYSEIGHGVLDPGYAIKQILIALN